MKFYKPYQLAKELGKSRNTIYRWMREGKIPKTSIKKVKVIKEITVLRFPDELIKKIKDTNNDI